MKALFRTLLAVAWCFASANASAADSFKPNAAGYIRDWLMLAPIKLPGEGSCAELLLRDQIRNEGALKPKAGDTATVSGKELTWKHITAATNHFDFNAILKTENDRSAAYVVTYIECEKEMPNITMALGSNDQGRLYLNGQDIYAFQDSRVLELDADKGKVTLKKGVNVIVFKIINEIGNWQGSMRFLDDAGAPITSLNIKLQP